MQSILSQNVLHAVVSIGREFFRDIHTTFHVYHVGLSPFSDQITVIHTYQPYQVLLTS